MNGPTIVQGGLSVGSWLSHTHRHTPPASSTVRSHSAASLLWENKTASPIPTLPRLPQATYCQILPPVNLPGWSRKAKQAGATPQECRCPSSPCKMSACYWKNKATKISRYLHARGSAPNWCFASQVSRCTTCRRSALNAITCCGQEVAWLGDSYRSCKSIVLEV